MPARLKAPDRHYATRRGRRHRHHRYAHTISIMCSAAVRHPLRHRCRPRGSHLVGVQSVQKKAECRLESAPGNDRRASPISAPNGGRPGNPLGARAMLSRWHGLSAFTAPTRRDHRTRVSSGCIRLTNEDVSILYSRVNVGTKVIVLPMDRRADSADGRRS